MEKLVRLKTPSERRQDIKRELDNLERMRQYARRDYEKRMREIAEQENRLMKKLERIGIDGRNDEDRLV